MGAVPDLTVDDVEQQEVNGKTFGTVKGYRGSGEQHTGFISTVAVD